MVTEHCKSSASLGTGEIAVPNVSDSTVTFQSPSSGLIRGVIVSLSGLPSHLNNGTANLGSLTLPAGARLDTSGVSYTNGSATITDPAAVASDVGASVSPGNTPPGFFIPSTAVVQTVNAGVSFTVQNNAAGLPTGSGSSVILNANPNTIFGRSGGFAFSQQLANDGWIVATTVYPEEFYLSTASLGAWNDFFNDASFGARYKAMTLLWYDHLVDYIRKKFNPQIPIVPFGGSWGGLHTLLWASNPAPTRPILGFMAAIPATLVSNVSTVFIGPVNFGPATINGYPGLPNGTSGIDIGTTDLNTITTPGIVGPHTIDSAVGWSNTTVAVGSNGATVTGITTLFVADQTKIVVGPLIKVTCTGGFAFYNVTSNSTSGQLSVTYLSGSGTVATGGLVMQNTADLLTANAITAGAPVTRYVNSNSTDNHNFTVNDATNFMSWVTGTLDPLAPKTY